jgi:membrane-bound lytic murein transglycosylase MltF
MATALGAGRTAQTNPCRHPACRRGDRPSGQRLAALAAAALVFGGAQAAQLPAPQGLHVKQITHEKFTGDFDQMLERRLVRVLVPYSRTLYFNDKGTQRGVTADLMHEFERHLNRKYARRLGKRPLTVFMMPTTRDELFDDVAQGLGDIAVGNLSITEQRLGKVDFARLPDGPTNDEVIALGPKSPPLASLDDLAGKTIHVRPAASYFANLQALNERFAREGKPPMKLVRLPDALEDEDKLEMLSVGLLSLVVIDDWKGRLWSQLLPNIKVREDLALKKDVPIGWAIRKGSPQLQTEIEAFLRHTRKTISFDTRAALALSQIRQLRNNTGEADLKRFQRTIALFEKYGARYGFDPVMLAALGYQESRLRQDVRSPAGAIGIMQVMPATGAALKVGDITQVEPNIHAGTKYLSQLMTDHFPDAKLAESDRPLFAVASYNAGPGRISQMRKEAARRGLDPDRWFNHVEQVTAEKVGIETTSYVRNIYKYYVAYTLMRATQAEQKNARDSVRKS